MSASPSGQSNGGTPNANGGPPKFIRKPKPADPLRTNRSRPQRPSPILKSSTSKPNGLKPVSRPGHASQSAGPSRAAGFSSSGSNTASLPKIQNSFSETPQGKYEDFPLYTTKRALKEGLRYHVARFATTKEDIDPTDQKDFTRPVSLHRRDPRLTQAGKAVKDEDLATGMPLDDKEQEKLEIAKLEREAQRAADLALIAPSSNTGTSTKKTVHKLDKTTQVFVNNQNAAQKKESDLRYEESIPWMLEDAENKHTWVGTYEAALSNANVILFIDENCFRMIPVDKWYKFTAKNQFKTMTIEEAEAQMSMKSKVSRWVMHTQEQQQQDQQKKDTQRLVAGLYKVKGESITYKRSGKTETQDADDIDFEGDLFEDDDEQPTVEPDRDEETKFAADKIKREQLGANLFGEGDENEVEKELQEEEKEEEAKKKLGKSMKKALKKREKNYLYDTDSSHPYSTTSDDDTSDEEEKIKEEERKKEEEAKLKAKSTAPKVPSGTSTKGTNTPLGRPKQGEHQKKHNHLKRPGSPNLSASETSGNESSRKKHKKKHVSSSSQPTGTSTPAPSRPMSPAPSSSQPNPGTNARKSSIVKLNLNPSKLSEIQSAPPNPSAIMSDGEGTAGEMSDSAGDHKRKSIKLRLGSSVSLSPSASRAGSPAHGSRAGSPAVAAGSQAQGQSKSMLDIYSPIALNLSGHFLSPTIYSFQEKWSVVPSLFPVIKKFRAKLSQGKSLDLQKRAFANALAKANGNEYEAFRSASPQAFRALVLGRYRFHSVMKHQTVEAHQWISLGVHMLTAASLCFLDTLFPPASGPGAARPPNSRPITVEEIITALPLTGISIGAMLKQFPGRINDKKDRDRFIKMVKENSSYSTEDKLLRPKA